MSLSNTKVKVVLGAGAIGDKSDHLARNLYTPELAQEYLNIFRKYGGSHIDTARGYSPGAPGTCEPILGQTDCRHWATIDTKIFRLPHLSRERITSEIEASLEALKVSKVHIVYFHAMDRHTPFEEQCEAMDEAYRAGKFEKFGLSNAGEDEVEKIVQICENNGWVKPTVYQGQYNAIARLPESKLFPVLRKYGVSFFAYSPAAGGLFSGGKRGDQNSRIGQMHASWYHKDALTEAANRVHEAATKAGITGHAVALRWLLHHSALSGEHGDAIVIGASSNEQLRANIDACLAGPLQQDVVDLVEEVWTLAERVAPPYRL